MIVIDGIVYSLQRMGGISTYFNAVLKRLPGSGLPFSAIGYDGSVAMPPEAGPATTIRRARRLERYRRCPVPDGAAAFHSSYYRLPARGTVPLITTIHDFTYERYVHGPRRWVHSTQKAAAIRRSQALICISESTRNDLFHFFPETDAKRVFVIHNGVSHAFFSIDTLDRPARPYAVFVGARQGYKNFNAAVRAVAAVPELDLVCVGGGDITPQERADLDQNLNGRFRHAGFIPDAALNKLYNGAACLIYPSAYEGFGIPVIEAMKAGCPVIAVAASSIPEVAGDAALLVESPEPELLAAAMASVLDPAERNRLRNLGFAQAARFDWDKTFAKIADIYRGFL